MVVMIWTGERHGENGGVKPVVLLVLLQRVQLLEQEANGEELGRIGQVMRAECLELGGYSCSLGKDVTAVRLAEVGAVCGGSVEFGEFVGDGRG